MGRRNTRNSPRTGPSIVNTKFGREIPKGVMVCRNKTGRPYNYFRPPVSRPDLVAVGRRRLDDDLVIAGQQAAEILGDVFVICDQMVATIKTTVEGTRNRSKQFGVPFDLTNSYLLDLYREQKGRCAISGLWMMPRKKGGASRASVAPSLDRIKPKEGYTKGNVRWVCLLVNIGMSDWGDAEFIRICHAVAEKNSTA